MSDFRRMSGQLHDAMDLMQGQGRNTLRHEQHQQPHSMQQSSRSYSSPRVMQQPSHFSAPGPSLLSQQSSYLSAPRCTQQPSHMSTHIQHQPSTSVGLQHRTCADQHSVTTRDLPLTTVSRQQQPTLSSLFHWNPSSTVGKKRKPSSASRGSKRKKLATWTHTFVCLASVNQDMIPDGQERAELQIAGLGEKRITISAFADAREIYDELAFQYSKLTESGGFELLRVPEGGKNLDVIACPSSGYTVSYLRAVVHHAKIYIRPLQKDLSLEPLKEPSYCAPPQESCLKCGELVSVTALREHIVACKKPTVSSRNGRDSPKPASVSDSPIIIQSPVASPALSHDGEEALPAALGQQSGDVIDIDEPQIISGDDGLDEVDPVLEVAIHLSKQEAVPAQTDIEPRSVGDVIKNLQCEVSKDSTFEMVVRRGKVLSDALRRMERLTFEPNKQLKVVFVGEQGSDTGGLTREFFRLIQYNMKSEFMEDTGCFLHNAVAYQDGVYFRLGMLAAMSLVHGGASFKLFSPSIYNFMCGWEASYLIVGIDEVPNSQIREFLKKIEASTTVDDLREKLMDNLDLVTECGYNRPIARVELGDKPNIVQTITLHKVVLSSLAELSQFREGLSAIGVLASLKEYPHLLSSYYSVEPKDELTSDTIRKMFTEIKYSESGTNARAREEDAYMFFIDYLDDCERVDTSSCEMQEIEDSTDIDAHDDDEASKISLKTILAFFTGADCIPPLGYKSATLTFNPRDPYPTASTCAIQLTLPTKYSDYDDFKSHMDTAFKMHGGFGLV